MVHFESQMRRRQDPAGTQSALIPMIVRPSSLPEWIRGLVPLDWTGSDSERRREWKKLLKLLGAPAPTVDPPSAMHEVDATATDPVVNPVEKDFGTPVATIELPQPLAGKYAVIQKMAETSLSTLFIAQNRQGTRYLVKKIKRKEGYRQEWIKQVASIYGRSKVASRVVLPVTVAEDQEAFYELLEFVEGWTVNKVMTMPGQVGVLGRLLEEWASQLLLLIEPLHQEGFIHRDINPYNVMISSKDLSLVLIDFSSSVPVDQAAQVPPLFCPGFSAPEQHDREYGTFNDVYSVGALIYYLANARPPPTYEDRIYRAAGVALEGRVYHRLGNLMEGLMTLAPEARLPNVTAVWQNVQRRGSTEVLDASERAVLLLPDRGGEVGMGYHRWRWRRPG
jgi:serine/threonine protein kinase